MGVPGKVTAQLMGHANIDTTTLTERPAEAGHYIIWRRSEWARANQMVRATKSRRESERARVSEPRERPPSLERVQTSFGGTGPSFARTSSKELGATSREGRAASAAKRLRRPRRSEVSQAECPPITDRSERAKRVSHANGASVAKQRARERVREFEGRSPSTNISAPSKTRTCDLLVRSQTLYPTELWARRCDRDGPAADAKP